MATQPVTQPSSPGQTSASRFQPKITFDIVALGFIHESKLADACSEVEESGNKRNSQVEANALSDLADTDLDNAAFQTKPLRQHCQKSPGINAIEEHLKDAIDGDRPAT
jgi:hypothetical protein